MKILGINLSHNFSICVYEEGEIKDVWLEERFNNFKNWRIDNKKEFKHHIISIFNKINFKPDLVCYSSCYRKYTHLVDDFTIIQNIQKQLDDPNYFFNPNHHHIYHALSCFYFSKLDEAMSIVIDGGGAVPFNDNYEEMESIFYLNKKTIFLLYQHLSNRKHIRTDAKIENYSDYGYSFYENNTEYLCTSKSIGGYDFKRNCDLIGFSGGKDAGKLMGLSSYAYSDKKYDLNYEHVEIAKNTQEKSFNNTCLLIEKAYEYKKIKNFVLSGGYFLNCSNNFKYVKKYPEFTFFVDPIPHDAGTAIGACVYYDKYK